MFPSPCGEKVGINSYLGVVSSRIREEVFPSPCGEKVGINEVIRDSWTKVKTNVSVPLRGKGRDQPKAALAGTAQERAVSVPLRGKGRDQLRTSFKGMSLWKRMRVSVPLRGKGRDQPYGYKRTRPLKPVSVPLRGKGRDQLLTVEHELRDENFRKFPSPCGEKVGINIQNGSNLGCKAWSFRPLAGKR